MPIALSREKEKKNVKRYPAKQKRGTGKKRRNVKCETDKVFNPVRPRESAPSEKYWLKHMEVYPCM